MKKISFRLGILVMLALLLLSCGKDFVATSPVASPPITPRNMTNPTPTVEITTTRTNSVSIDNEVMIKTIENFYSKNLDNSRTIEIYLPPEYNLAENAQTRYKVLYANDGQDMSSLNLKQTLEKLSTAKLIEPLIVVAIYANADRTKEYGTANIPNAQGLGAKAAAYTQFLTNEVLPYVNANYRTQTGATNTAIMGSSLGGLSAFDITWNHPDLFSRVGVFSGSFWWRTDDTNVNTKQASRIMHKIVHDSPKRPGLKMWFEAGTQDETSDRDGNGVIDAIQDTTELMDELRAKGYQDQTEMVYVQVENGKHNQATWATVLPDLLRWIFPK